MSSLPRGLKVSLPVCSQTSPGYSIPQHDDYFWENPDPETPDQWETREAVATVFYPKSPDFKLPVEGLHRVYFWSHGGLDL